MSKKNDTFSSDKCIEKDHDGVCEASICVKVWMKRPRDKDGRARKCLN
jgi:hypothetical protein